MVEQIESFVFFDLEGTGLTDNPRITEMSFIAIHRQALQDAATEASRKHQTAGQYLPRVLNKLTVCMYPMKPISKEAANMTGLYNETLLDQKDLDHDLFDLLTSFFRRLKPPVCLISHNGFRFDFPLLKAEFGSIGCDLLEDILCLDTWEMFRSLEGWPVPDTSQYLNSSIIISRQLKKKHASQGLPEADVKRMKSEQVMEPSASEVGTSQHLPMNDTFGDKLNSDVELKPETGKQDGVVEESTSSKSAISGPSLDSGVKCDEIVRGQPDGELPSTLSSCSVSVPDVEAIECDVKEMPSSSHVNEVGEMLPGTGDLECGACLSGNQESKSMVVDNAAESISESRLLNEKVSDETLLSKNSEEKMSSDERQGIHMLQKILAESAKNVDSSRVAYADSSGSQGDSDSEYNRSRRYMLALMGKSKTHNQNQRSFNDHPHPHRNMLPRKRLSYKLADIHFRVVGCYPSGTHRAEDDCLALARIFMFNPESTQWADNHAVPFAALRPLYHIRRTHLAPGVFPEPVPHACS